MPLNNPTVVNLNAPTSATATRSTIAVPADTVTPAVLAAVNVNRKGLSFWNNSTGAVLVELGAAPTATAYTARIEAGGYFELPFGFTGQVQGLWTALGGVGVFVREFS